MSPDLETVQQAIKPIKGWLRPEQASQLWKLAGAVASGGTIVEIGSYQGKSTIVLASAAPQGVVVYAIDPHAGNDRGPREWHGEPDDGQADHLAFLANIEAHGVNDRITHVREFSQRAQHLIEGTIDLLYVDGAHGYRPALSDITEWGARVVPGGFMAIHDVHTSVFVTLAVTRTLWFSAEWRYVGRERSMSVYERVPVRGMGRVNSSVRQLANVPWFVKNLIVRGLDTIGLKRLSKLGQGPGGGVY